METKPIRGVFIMNERLKSWILLISFFTFVIIGVLLQNFFVILIGFVALILLFTTSNAWFDKMKNKTNEEFSNKLKQNNFTPNKKFITDNLLQGLAVSEENEQIVLVSRNKIDDEFSFKTFKFKDIIETKVITGKDTLTSTSLGSVVARGVVGGLLFGGIGSIGGMITSKSTSTQKIKELTLELVADDILNPRHTITFYKKELPIKESNPNIQEIETWYRILSVIINRNSNKARSV
jgi:hypothetical protein